MRSALRFAPAFAMVLGLAAPAHSQAAVKLAATYSDAISELNEQHARSPGKETEGELAKKLPASARKAFDELLELKSDAQLTDALKVAALAAADLDLAADFARIRERATQLSTQLASQVGLLVSREAFNVRGTGGLDQAYLEHFADVFDAILVAYDETFGFTQWSKVPGKKLRVLVHLVTKIEAPPHFAPEFPYHSEIDFPVDDASAFTSPTDDGKFLFYGLCHELGHVIAMWGDAKNEEDHHAWAHYAGVAVVEHIARDPTRAKLFGDLRDGQWRSLDKEREAAKGVKPSLESREGVMALWLALHEAVGARGLGAAINALDAKDRALRINGVRYYSFDNLKRALLDGAKSAEKRTQIETLLP